MATDHIGGEERVEALAAGSVGDPELLEAGSRGWRPRRHRPPPPRLRTLSSPPHRCHASLSHTLDRK
uniref:Uncharacterized protein n=1 Tax=Oryza sativa subsp. japonica TaxID=39947 RepID=Q6K6U7_ORYSJ|nr:hypothetical protein [Oryza sativa Japonica Group]BAD21949.1 hypothetical protein [Oryza sativa Japonica Group]